MTTDKKKKRKHKATFEEISEGKYVIDTKEEIERQKLKWNRHRYDSEIRYVSSIDQKGDLVQLLIVGNQKPLNITGKRITLKLLRAFLKDFSDDKIFYQKYIGQKPDLRGKRIRNDFKPISSLNQAHFKPENEHDYRSTVVQSANSIGEKTLDKRNWSFDNRVSEIKANNKNNEQEKKYNDARLKKDAERMKEIKGANQD